MYLENKQNISLLITAARVMCCFRHPAIRHPSGHLPYTAILTLKHTTTLFSLSAHYILSQEWRVFVNQVKTNYHVMNIVMLGCVLSHLRILSCGKSLGLRPRPFPQLRIRKNKTFVYICAMLDQRRRRWADVVQMLHKCFVFAGLSQHY